MPNDLSSPEAISKPIVNRLVVIGLGLIGSSLAAAAREKGLANQVIGISRRTSTVEMALKMGIIDRGEASLTAIASELDAGDLLVIGVPTLPSLSSTFGFDMVRSYVPSDKSAVSIPIATVAVPDWEKPRIAHTFGI